MRRQIGINGARISVAPRFLVVGPGTETVAEQVLTALAATTAETTNPFAGRLELLVEPRITGPAWYVLADPAVMPALEYSELDGSRPMSGPGPQLSTQAGFNVDGLELKVSYDIG